MPSSIIKMKKTIIAIIIGIALISLISAIFAGDCIDVDLSNMTSLDNVVYMVVGNSSNMEGLSIELNETTGIASICTKVNYKPDNFTLIFIDNSTKEVITTIYSSGGGGGIRYIDKNVTNYVYRNITEYLDKPIEEPIDCVYCKGSFNIMPWVFLGLIIIYMFITVISSRKKTKEIKEIDENYQTEFNKEDNTQ